MPYPAAPPVPRTWFPQMQVKAGYLRADAAAAVQVLGTPPMFTGYQASAQSIPSSTDQDINIDTELYDNLGGHVSTVSNRKYFGQFPGWYLCQGVTPLDYTGGAGAVDAEIAFTASGGSATFYHGQRIPNSGTSGQRAAPVVAKLVQMVTVGGTSAADFAELAVNQNSGASQNLYTGTNLFPQFQAKWVCAGTGTTVASLPLGYAPAWPGASAALTAAANSGTASLSVTSADGLAAGGTLGVDEGTPLAETVTIAGTYTPGSLTVPLTANLVSTHQSGAGVSVPVSAAFLNNGAVRDPLRRLLYPPVTEVYYSAGTATLASQSALPAIGTLLPCDTVRADTYAGVNSGGFNTGTSAWTAPIAGQYWCYVQCHQSMNSTSQALAAGLTVRSANYNSGTQVTLWGGAQDAFSGSGAGNCAVARRRLRLNAGDTIQGAAFQRDSGSAATALDFSGGASVSESRMIIIWAGA